MEAPIFEKIYRDYLDRVSAMDLSGRGDLLGISVSEEGIRIPFYGRPFTVTPHAITDSVGRKPHHAVSVILCQYLLLCPEHSGEDRSLATFKDFRDAAPYVGGFRNTAELAIARQFSGRIEALVERARALGAEPYETEVSCQLALRLPALPMVPIHLLFNDADEEFPADCTLLFERRAEHHLDMECLAMIGSILATWLGHRSTPH